MRPRLGFEPKYHGLQPCTSPLGHLGKKVREKACKVALCLALTTLTIVI